MINVEKYSMTAEPLDPTRFVDLALEVAPASVMSLVAAVVDERGVSTGELVVISHLPSDAEGRAALLAEATAWLHTTATRAWRYKAHAIVEPTDDGRLAALAIIAEV